MTDVVVVGQIGRDLVLRVAALPASGRSAHAGERRELLGGKGANQAVALARLGIPVTLVGVVGDDHSGDEACAQAAPDGVDVSRVVRRPGAATALLLQLQTPAAPDAVAPDALWSPTAPPPTRRPATRCSCPSSARTRWTRPGRPDLSRAAMDAVLASSRAD